MVLRRFAAVGSRYGIDSPFRLSALLNALCGRYLPQQCCWVNFCLFFFETFFSMYAFYVCIFLFAAYCVIKK